MSSLNLLRRASRRPRQLVGRVLRRAGLIPENDGYLKFSPELYRIRRFLANEYLRGDGIEIGALNHPLQVPTTARVRYVDRKDTASLRAEYPELFAQRLVEVDLVDDAEKLHHIADQSLDFLIANHFLEHAPNPIAVLRRFIDVVKPGGALYVAIPDKRMR